MTSPLPLPDWVPWWVHVVLLLAALLFAALFLLMPFSVFGVKARLEGVEARLDEIQGELRSLSLRLPEAFEDGPPPMQAPMPSSMQSPAAPRVIRPAGRTEPRLY